jgi:hypothetical protein
LHGHSQLDKATADAAEFKAGFDKAVYDNFEQKAQVGCLRDTVLRFAGSVVKREPRLCMRRACTLYANSTLET